MNKDKRRGHLDHVRSNMTRSDHNTVPALNKTDDAVEAAWQRFRSRLEAGLAGCDPKFIFAAGYQEALASRPTETDGKADWEFLRDTVTPPAFYHNREAWSVMWRLIERRVQSRQPTQGERGEALEELLREAREILGEAPCTTSYRRDLRDRIDTALKGDRP